MCKTASYYAVLAPMLFVSPHVSPFAYVASLGINESGGDGLDIQFAQTVTIRCK